MTPDPGRWDRYRTKSYPPSDNVLQENSPPPDCAKTDGCRNNAPARTLMAKKLEQFEDKKVGQPLTASVNLHQAKGDHVVALRNSPVDGNEFLSDVAGSGASAATVSAPTRAMNSQSDFALLYPAPNGVQVQDTLTTLHKLAPNCRQLMPQRPVSSPLPAASGITITTL